MRILVCPLDWGLGHATRCIPIIRYLIEKKVEVIIGASGVSMTLLKEQFPGLEFITLPGYNVRYSSVLPIGLKVLMQFPRLISAVRKEHKILEQVINDKKIDAVISDNRYGVWSDKIPSVIITHQLNIMAPFGKNLLNNMALEHIKKFNECWIPDYEGEENLSGNLSHPLPKEINAKYIGILSRFEPIKNTIYKTEYQLLVILSGPEPQRSKLEKIILQQLQDLPLVKTLIIEGLPGEDSKKSGLQNVEIIPHLNDTEFCDKIYKSDIILSRSGYSTIMDLYALGWKKVIFIPTPGQTEQEYLGELFKKKKRAVVLLQKGFLLKDALKKTDNLAFTDDYNRKEEYKSLIDRWMTGIDNSLPIFH